MPMRKTSGPDLTFVMLGTGGAFTDFRVNYHNNAAVKTSAGWVLIDCGGTAMQSLKELGIKPWEVAGIIVTHRHGDHTGGIEQYIWENYYTGPIGVPYFRKTRIYTSEGLQNAVHRTLLPSIEHFTGPDGTIWDDVDALVEYPKIDDESESDLTAFHIGGVWFEFVPVNHVGSFGEGKESYGVVVRGTSQSFFYTSDMVFSPGLLEHYLEHGGVTGGVDLIMHDCTFGPLYPGTVHTHYEQLLTLPPEVRRKVVLMHHTEVPKETDVLKDGFMWAAGRQEYFALSPGQVAVSKQNSALTTIVAPGFRDNDTDENMYIHGGALKMTRPTADEMDIEVGGVGVVTDD